MKYKGKITRFLGCNLFLSNFHYVEIEYKGQMYPTLEHAYQAAKTLSKKHRRKIQRIKYPGHAKKYGKEVLAAYGLVRDDWKKVNIGIMRKLLKQKFSATYFKNRLLSTRRKKLIEGNYWGDRFWGMAVCSDGKLRGKNHLGKLLMEIRKELRS